MKTRNGFVSNSSSASYYVTLKGTPESIFSDIFENCDWPSLRPENLKEKIALRIESLQRRIDDIDNKRERFLAETKPGLEKQLNKYKEYAIKLEEGLTTKELVTLALELNYIDIENIYESGIDLVANTVMHNSYTEGMPEFLQDIVLYYSFEQSSKINLRVSRSE